MQVTDVDQIKAHLKLSVDKFQGDCIKLYLHKWKKLTSDMEVTGTVSGMSRNIASNLAIINKYQYPFNDKEDAFIESEIQNLLKKVVMQSSNHEPGEFFLTIFLREKSDGGYYFILNLKKVNESVEYKWRPYSQLRSLLDQICKFDIKDAYYSIPIYEPRQKFLKFEYKSRLFKFTVFPNGYTEGTRKFT